MLLLVLPYWLSRPTSSYWDKKEVRNSQLAEQLRYVYMITNTKSYSLNIYDPFSILENNKLLVFAFPQPLFTWFHQLCFQINCTEDTCCSLYFQEAQKICFTKTVTFISLFAKAYVQWHTENQSTLPISRCAPSPPQDVLWANALKRLTSLLSILPLLAFLWERIIWINFHITVCKENV